MSVEQFRIPSDHAETLVDAKAYADGRIYDTHAWLRKNLPIGRAEPEGYDPFWVITRYDDLRAISRDNQAFHSGDRSIVLTSHASELLVRKLTGDKPFFVRTLVQMDPPDHMKYRLLTQGWFAPNRIGALQERLDKLAAASVDKMRSRDGACDFAAEIGLHYPLEVIMDILGVPKEDHQFMLQLTQEVFAPLDPDSMPEGLDLDNPAFLAEANKATLDRIGAYFSRITEDRRRQPRDDLSSVIANAQVDGQAISEMDTQGYYTIVATAGHDTTSSSIAAAMHALAADPKLFSRLKADAGLIPAFVQEAIRWAAPVKTFMRSATKDADFQGAPFRAKDWIMLCYASANRDEAVIRDADKFDIDRPKFDHVSFGYGAHVCLGQHLARLEMKILFEHLVPALKSVALDGEVELSQSFFVNGAKHLPIRFELEAN
ncbi:MAG TPA: cytochrome P450 [Rhizomicrobium sp.]